MSEREGSRPVPVTLAIALLAALGVGGLEVHAQYAAVSPEGSEAELWLSGLVSLPFMVGALVASLGAPPFLLFRRTRRRAAQLLAAGAVFLLAFVVCGNLGRRIRMDAFLELSHRSAPSSRPSCATRPTTAIPRPRSPTWFLPTCRRCREPV